MKSGVECYWTNMSLSASRRTRRRVHMQHLRCASVTETYRINSHSTPINSGDVSAQKHISHDLAMTPAPCSLHDTDRLLACCPTKQSPAVTNFPYTLRVTTISNFSSVYIDSCHQPGCCCLCALHPASRTAVADAVVGVAAGVGALAGLVAPAALQAPLQQTEEVG